MKDNLITAFKYLYLSNKKMLDNNLFKGLRYKQAYEFKKTFDELAKMIDKNQVEDLEEVLSYGK